MKSFESADFALDPPALAGFVARDLTLGKDVTLLVEPSYGAATVDHLASRLRGGRDRVVCVSAAADGGLDCAGLLRQLGQQAGHLVRDAVDANHENEIAVLTALDPTCDRIVLLVADADFLEHGALRAIQLACQASIRLRLVFAGHPRILMKLEEPEFSTLGGRLLRGVRYTYAAEGSDVVHAPVALPGRIRAVKLAVAASVCVVLVASAILTRWRLPHDIDSAPAAPQIAAVPLTLLPPASEPAVPETAEASVEAVPEPIEVPVPTATPVLPKDSTGSKETAPPGRPIRHGPSPSVGHLGKHDIPVREPNLLRYNTARVSVSRPVSEYRPPLPRNLVEREHSEDYIGTFAAGPDGVRSFQYRR